MIKKGRKISAKKPTYWVRSKQTKEPSSFGRRPVPARFKTLEEAKRYRQDLNLNKGAYHPGYFVEEQDDTPLPVPVWPAGP